MTSVELLAPARNLATAREAILHGADAVYIGAPRFGARASAGNTLEEIAELVPFAHLYRVKVYVTLNTILYDDELEEARQLAIRLYELGVDALIVQDMAFLEMDLPPIALHASTQMDNRTAEKVRWLHELGFEQAVLARELTLQEIGDIHRQVPEMPLEVFVHGSTCVSYNGQCYASQYCFGRSANRGECAQFCRLPFDLIDENGAIVSDGRTGRPVKGRHLLSLHDMNRADDLEALLDAGAVSLKIEGRLKDETYVKNVVAYYRQRLDSIFKRRPQDYQRSSIGVSQISFTPQLERTFNRGFSSYFLHGRTTNMVQQSSPKSMGQLVGHVKEIRRHCFTVSGTVPFANGDGLCFVDEDGRLQGFRVNRVEGNCLYPKEMPAGLQPRMPLYRNFDQAFSVQLSHPTAVRRIPVRWEVKDKAENDSSNTRETGNTKNSSLASETCNSNGASFIYLSLSCSDGVTVSSKFGLELTLAHTSQYENIQRQLSKLGDTPFETQQVDVHLSQDWFIPSSCLSEWRRTMVNLLVKARQQAYGQNNKRAAHIVSSLRPFAGLHLDYRSNVSNRLSRHFYEQQGAANIAPAMEVASAEHLKSTPFPSSDYQGKPIMSLRYCPKYELGLCSKQADSTRNYVGPLFLRSVDGRVFPLHFDCRHCQVQVLAPTK